MIPYITNRGGPMVGLEALSMQGLPVDKLLLTRETEDQLADLAGNAMSTTVVGACMLAALVTGKRLLKSGDDMQSYEMKAGGSSDDVVQDAMNIDAPEQSLPDGGIVSEEQLVYRPLDLSMTNLSSFRELLTKADRSSRLCECEGRVDMTSRELFRCGDCGTSSCKKCGGRPEHSPVPIDFEVNARLPPSDFTKELKSALPMCISLSHVTQELLDHLKGEAGIQIPGKRWSLWCAAVLRAASSELRFAETKRQEIWSAVYRSPVALLELLLHPQQPEWRLYALPEDSEPANADIRRVLELPIGRLSLGDGLFAGRWEFALPYVTTISVKIKGVGNLVPSWEARLGLVGDDFKDKVVHPRLEITVSKDSVTMLDRDISGVYTLLEKCGTANGALHKKEPTDIDPGLPSLFMLLDPHRTDDSQDCFVFSVSKRRYEYSESRPLICKLDPSWRQSSRNEEQDVSCCIPCRWVTTDRTNLEVSLTLIHFHVDLKFTSQFPKPFTGHNAQFATPAQTLQIPISRDSCRDAIALLVCSASLRGQAGSEWPRGKWKDVDKVHERGTFKALAWLLERVRQFDDDFGSWKTIESLDDHSNCERCAPTPPKVKWTQMSNKKIVAVEDPVDAGEYERRLKKRPSPFVTQLNLDENDVGTVRVGVNIPSLLHRALACLPSDHRPEKPVLSWRIDTNFTPMASLNLPTFKILSNKLDPEHEQPPSFKVDLRPEQLRSLEWMIKQESRDAEPFVEEEISEAILGALSWRAVGRAQRPVRIRGGVLADQVGYGKTAITLGLIDCTSRRVDKEFAKMGRVPGKISVKGSLVIVPPHLTRQWNSEVKKFTGKRFKVLVLSTVTNLNSTTIEDIQEADIIVVASNIFKSGVYLENLQLLSGAGELPSKDGRHFNARLDACVESLRTQTDLLQDQGPMAVLKHLKEAEERSAYFEHQPFLLLSTFCVLFSQRSCCGCGCHGTVKAAQRAIISCGSRESPNRGRGGQRNGRGELNEAY
jgi:hypothetical protein